MNKGWNIDNQSRTATVVVAASNSSAKSKQGADYVCDGVADQNTIDAALIVGVGGKVILMEGDYSVNNPITPPSYTNLEILGKITIAPAVTSLLTTNAASGQATVTIADASKFFVGQWVAISDNNRAVQGGGTGQTRKVGDAGIITDITGNNITLDGNLNVSMTVAANAYITSAPNAILIDSKTNIKIYSGEIDANRSHQTDFEPLVLANKTNPASEEVRSMQGITVFNSSHITIKNMYVHSATVTNINVQYHSSYITLEGNWCDGGHDKNIIVASLGTGSNSYVLLKNNICTNAIFEDGISFYTGNKYCTSESNMIVNSNRNGICFNATKNATSFYLKSIGDTIVGGASNISSPFVIAASNCEIIGLTIDTSNLSIGPGSAMLIIGDNIDINDSIINVGKHGISQGIAFGPISSNYGTNVRLHNLQILNAISAIITPSGSSGVVERCMFSGNTTNVTDNSAGAVTFKNNIGYVTENKGTATVASGATSIVVTHGLSKTPNIQDIIVTPTNNPTNAVKYWVDTITSTQFTINTSTDPGTSGATFTWQIN